MAAARETGCPRDEDRDGRGDIDSRRHADDGEESSTRHRERRSRGDSRHSRHRRSHSRRHRHKHGDSDDEDAGDESGSYHRRRDGDRHRKRHSRKSSSRRHRHRDSSQHSESDSSADDGRMPKCLVDAQKASLALIAALPSAESALRTVLAAIERGDAVSTSAISDKVAREGLESILSCLPGVSVTDEGWKCTDSDRLHHDLQVPRGESVADVIIHKDTSSHEPATGSSTASSTVGKSTVGKSTVGKSTVGKSAVGSGKGSVDRLLALVARAENHRIGKESTEITRSFGKVQGAGSGAWDHKRYMASGPHALGQPSAGTGKGSLLQHLLGKDVGATSTGGRSLGGMFQ